MQNLTHIVRKEIPHTPVDLLCLLFLNSAMKYICSSCDHKVFLCGNRVNFSHFEILALLSRYFPLLASNFFFNSR